MFSLFSRNKENIQSSSEPGKTYFFLGRFNREHIKDFCFKYDTVKHMSDEELLEKYWDAPRLIDYKNELKEPTFKLIESIERGDWEIKQYTLNQFVLKNGKGKRISLFCDLHLLINQNEFELQLSSIESELITFKVLMFIKAENKKNEARNRKEFFDYLNS